MQELLEHGAEAAELAEGLSHVWKLTSRLRKKTTRTK